MPNIFFYPPMPAGIAQNTTAAYSVFYAAMQLELGYKFDDIRIPSMGSSFGLFSPPSLSPSPSRHPSLSPFPSRHPSTHSDAAGGAYGSAGEGVSEVADDEDANIQTTEKDYEEEGEEEEYDTDAAHLEKLGKEAGTDRDSDKYLETEWGNNRELGEDVLGAEEVLVPLRRRQRYWRAGGAASASTGGVAPALALTVFYTDRVLEAVGSNHTAQSIGWGLAHRLSDAATYAKSLLSRMPMLRRLLTAYGGILRAAFPWFPAGPRVVPSAAAPAGNLELEIDATELALLSFLAGVFVFNVLVFLMVRRRRQHLHALAQHQQLPELHQDRQQQQPQPQAEPPPQAEHLE